jgi:hypothetical protein
VRGDLGFIVKISYVIVADLVIWIGQDIESLERVAYGYSAAVMTIVYACIYIEGEVYCVLEVCDRRPL